MKPAGFMIAVPTNVNVFVRGDGLTEAAATVLADQYVRSISYRQGYMADAFHRHFGGMSYVDAVNANVSASPIIVYDLAAEVDEDAPGLFATSHKE